ncbi:JAB domain-containing protein [Lutimonas vermicola]|uniref:JAB domain-containing protein n=1 Tax=Lutimonas vermicola TaxID=414288 RepID=A0ABU9L4Y9_9FLAO
MGWFNERSYRRPDFQAMTLDIVSIDSRQKAITDKVKKAAEIMDIKLPDHLILTEDTYYSFAQHARL